MKLPVPIIWVFVLIALVQLAVPASMIWGQEKVLSSGKAYLFKTAPIDPSDPFRGKYIVLDYESNEFPISDPDAWTRNQEVYVSLKTDSEGFAQIAEVTSTIPDETIDFVSARISYVQTYDESPHLIIDYPFDRYYMEESKAYDAEVMTREVQRDTSLTAYAVVHVLEGKAVLADVQIDGVPIREWVEKAIE